MKIQMCVCVLSWKSYFSIHFMCSTVRYRIKEAPWSSPDSLSPACLGLVGPELYSQSEPHTLSSFSAGLEKCFTASESVAL